MSSGNKLRDDFVKLLAPDAIILKLQGCDLQGVHAYSNVDYIRCVDATDSTFDAHVGSFCCFLCRTILFRGMFQGKPQQIKKLEMHVHSDMHEARYCQLLLAQKKHAQSKRQLRLKEGTFCLQERAQRLMLPRWRWHMSDLIMQYINSQPATVRERWDKAFLQLAKYEQMERLSLLELAILKCNLCIDHPTQEEGGSKKRRRVVDDSTGNNNNNIMLTAQTVKSGAEIIIPLVITFLGGPQLIET